MITFQRKGDLPQPVPESPSKTASTAFANSPRKSIGNRTPTARRAATDRRPRTTAYFDIAVTPVVATRDAGRTATPEHYLRPNKQS